MKSKQGNVQARPTRVRRVLVVEDEPSAREASQRYLAHCGYQVQAAADASAALASAADNPPDLAVCDWRLGGGDDGVDVARALQEAHGTAVIFATARPLDELREVTRDLNVTAYLRKPISLRALASVIESVAPKTD